jgi:hypothetical protein
MPHGVSAFVPTEPVELASFMCSGRGPSNSRAL